MTNGVNKLACFAWYSTEVRVEGEKVPQIKNPWNCDSHGGALVHINYRYICLSAVVVGGWVMQQEFEIWRLSKIKQRLSKRKDNNDEY